MKTEKNRRFRFNWIDCVVVILVVAVAGFLFWKFGAAMTHPGEETRMTYRVKVEELAPEAYDSMAKTVPAPLVDGGEKLDGQVTGVEKVPHMLAADEENSGAWIEDPYHVDVIFTIQANVTEAGGVILGKVGEQEVRIGTKYTVETEYFEMDGTVLSVDR